MFGPDVIVVAGNHNTAVVGRFMSDVREKRPQDDKGVTIEDDVWVAGRAIITDGVTIGRGSIVGAGSVVTASVPPYSVVAGVPARIIRSRWTLEVALNHEAALYPPSERLPLSRMSHLR